MHILYSFLVYLLCPFLLIRLFFKGPDYRVRWIERLGYSDRALPPKHIIWVHAVSVGEVHAAVPLVKELLQDYAHCQILLTTVTPTGAASVKRCLQDTVEHLYLPYDAPIAIKRFMATVKPSVLMIMETELWPNVLHYCGVNNVPVVIVNGRMSKKSARGYKRLAWLTRPVFNNISLVLAQSKEDAVRFIDIGFASEKVIVTGNVKFDLHLSSDILGKAEDLRKCLGKLDRLIWVAASTHQGEEEIVLDAFSQLLEKKPECLLVIVPRHPDRSVSVKRLCCKQGFTVFCKSDNKSSLKDTQIFILDTIGELLTYYAVADVAFVGGSLTKVGGHNMLEPASFGVPVLTGPHVFNFKEISQLLLKQRAAWTVFGANELFNRVNSLLDNCSLRHAMGERGRNVVLNNTGTASRAIRLIKGIFDDCLLPDISKTVKELR